MQLLRLHAVTLPLPGGCERKGTTSQTVIRQEAGALRATECESLQSQGLPGTTYAGRLTSLTRSFHVFP